MYVPSEKEREQSERTEGRYPEAPTQSTGFIFSQGGMNPGVTGTHTQDTWSSATHSRPRPHF